MHLLRTPVLVLAAFVVAPAFAGAQRPIELGIDGAIAWTKIDAPEGIDADWRTNVDIPVANFRIGFLTTDRRWSVEPSLAFSRLGVADATATQTQLDVGLLYHFAVATARDPGKPQPYLRPFIGFEHTSISGVGNGGEEDDSDTRMRLGLGVGVKLPMIDRLAGRLEARYFHVSEGDIGASTNGFALGFGLSFFTR